MVELLVAIAIIALLMAILVPTLSRVRRQTKATICQSNLKQLGFLFLIYANNNNDSTPTTTQEWPYTLHPYYNKKEGLSCCPMATKPVNKGGRHPFAAFSVGATYSSLNPEGSIYGSYGINGWVSNPSQGITTNAFGLPTTNNYRNINVKGAGKIPLFLDSMWIDSYPDNTNIPPQRDGSPYESDSTGAKQIRFFCINRHDEFINSVFLDFSVKKVGLKELWKLKWHRNSDLNAPTPEWPDWMKKFKDY